MDLVVAEKVSAVFRGVFVVLCDVLCIVLCCVHIHSLRGCLWLRQMSHCVVLGFSLCAILFKAVTSTAPTPIGLCPLQRLLWSAAGEATGGNAR